MSEELEWELYDVFEAGLFAFPLYEHQTARKIVRYLIYRGVLEEEIADAIEDSTIDLHVWLNRQGKNMVGEWVIAWVNDVRDEYLAEKEREARENGYELRDTISRERRHSSLSHEGTSTDGDAPDGNNPTRRGRRRHRLIPLDDSSSTSSDASSDFDEETEVKRPISPPPLPPRSLGIRRGANSDDLLHLRHIDSSDSDSLQLSEHKCKEGDDGDVMQLTFAPPRHQSPDLYQHTPDSGAVSDIYSTIPSDTPALCNESGLPTTTTCATHGTKHIISQAGCKVCPNCRCTVAHYAYLNKASCTATTTSPTMLTQPTIHNQNGGVNTSIMTPLLIDTGDSATDIGTSATNSSDSGGHYIFSESTIRAMELHIDTLDRDGPGYIFIMTDSLENCLPWSSEHRYKVGASRRPERFVTEFRAMNISIELIWQVRVDHHMKAVKEIHSCLDEYNLHSNWFKCSLSVIMDTISKTVRKYRSA